ncbi:MAG: GyrI-like domain-containing protein [Dehalococcoidia bacterium]
MIEPPEITQSSARQTAVIHLTIPREEIQAAMGPAITEVLSVLGAQGIAPAGPLFDRHFRMDEGTFDFEVGFPVETPVTATGRVHAGELPAARVARTVYHGGYEGLGAAWGEFDSWLAAQGHTPAAGLWECFLVGPESGPDEADWRTELVRPLTS